MNQSADSLKHIFVIARIYVPVFSRMLGLSHRLRRNSAESESLLVRLPSYLLQQHDVRMLLGAGMLLRGLRALRTIFRFLRLALQPFALEPTKQLGDRFL